MKRKNTNLYGVMYHVTITMVAVLIFSSYISGSEHGVSRVRVPEDYKSIQEACRELSPGDTIILSAGIYRLTEAIVLTKPCTITSASDDRNQVIIESSGTGPFCVDIPKEYPQQDVTIKSITLKNKAIKKWPVMEMIHKMDVDYSSFNDFRNLSSKEVDEVENGRQFNLLFNSDDFKKEYELSITYTPLNIKNGNVKLENCNISSNSGSGVYACGNSTCINIVECMFESIFWTGLDISDHVSATITDTVFSKIKRGIYAKLGCVLLVTKCLFKNMETASIYISRNTQAKIQSCKMTDTLGILAVYINSATVEINDSLLNRGIYVTDSTVQLKSCMLKSPRFGISACNQSKVILDRIDVSDSIYGVGIDKESKVTLQSSDIHGNIVGVCCQNGSRITIRDSHIHDNSIVPFAWIPNKKTEETPIAICELFPDISAYSTTSSGGIYVNCSSACELHNCRILNNGLYGVNIVVISSLKMNACELRNNGIGVGLDYFSYGSIDNCEMNANEISGLRVLKGVRLKVTNSRISNNQEGIVTNESDDLKVENVTLFNNVYRTKAGKPIEGSPNRNWVIGKSYLETK